MTRYVIRRLIQAIPTLLGVSIIAFFLVNSTPGDPILIRTFDPNITEETRDILRRQLGLDQSLPLQYIRWFTGVSIRTGDVAEEFSINDVDCNFVSAVNLTFCDSGGGILRGNLGTSIETKQPVWNRISERLPATLELGAAALIVALLIGVPLGVLSAVYQGSIFDNVVRVLAVVGNALPVFWFGLMCIFFFGVFLGWLPTGGRQTVSLTNEFDLLDRLRHLILPTMILAFGNIAGMSRFMRTETLEVIRTDYIRTAKAKGLPGGQIWFIHAMRNAMVPLMTLLGPAVTGVLTGAVITETIFAWPGMGRLAFNAAVQRDYPTVLGTVMFFAVLTILGNLLSDIFYGIVDPRVRLA
ncbi:MAG: ABC transporter permease [Caldilineaceae bacterium]|nr:ABC transporter permease [Caldilineaceae bacterium]